MTEKENKWKKKERKMFIMKITRVLLIEWKWFKLKKKWFHLYWRTQCNAVIFDVLYGMLCAICDCIENVCLFVDKVAKTKWEKELTCKRMKKKQQHKNWYASLWLFCSFYSFFFLFVGCHFNCWWLLCASRSLGFFFILPFFLLWFLFFFVVVHRVHRWSVL